MNTCNICEEVINILDLGCYSHCGVITLGIRANQSGIHTILFNYGSFTHVSGRYVKKGDFIQLDNDFNENAAFELEIINPDGTDYEARVFNKIMFIEEKYKHFKMCIKPTKHKIIKECNWCSLPIEQCYNDQI
ncbi:MAG: hypothetical protein IT276_14895 [Ignavibacteriaceae bacterium]|nr:hypothetical protein [Ignavibacteriaceae bacterium]